MQRVSGRVTAVAAAAVLFIGGLVAGQASIRGGNGASVRLPSACDNFLAASQLFAEQGASAAISAGGDPLAADAETRAYETLRGLLASCDRDLATRME
jgi:hypothetical protein